MSTPVYSYQEIPGTPSRAERDFDAEAKARKYYDADIKRDSRLSDEDFAYVASMPDFPRILGKEYRGLRSSFNPMRQLAVFRDGEAVRAWFANWRRIVGVAK